MPPWTCADGGDPKTVDLDQLVFDAWMETVSLKIGEAEVLRLVGPDGNVVREWALVPPAQPDHAITIKGITYAGPSPEAVIELMRSLADAQTDLVEAEARRVLP